MATSRGRFLNTCLEQIGSPYIWGAKGELFDGIRAFDCSGLVTWALLRSGGPDWRAEHSAAKLWTDCTPATVLVPGTLVFYGPMSSPTHVMVHVGADVVVGAGGGGSTTKTLMQARASDARVKSFSSFAYRPDSLPTYRELPFLGPV